MSSAGFVLSLVVGFLLLGVSALLGTPFLYVITDILDYSQLSDENATKARELNDSILGFYAAFPFIIGVALLIRALMLASRSGQL